VSHTPQHRTGPDGGPQRHFGEDLLFEQRAGLASHGASLAVACHLALCPPCRALADELERVGTGLVGAEIPRPDLLVRILAGVAGTGAQVPPPASLAPEVLADLPALPAPLLRALAALPTARWRRMIPGVRAITLEERDRYATRLLRLRPGLVIPRHDHHGAEHTVVFAGGLDDHSGHLGRGDALTMLPGDQHQQEATAGEDCIALIVNELPARPLTWKGRLLKTIARL
jgi:putative transcriptional regulator